MRVRFSWHLHDHSALAQSFSSASSGVLLHKEVKEPQYRYFVESVRVTHQREQGKESDDQNVVEGTEDSGLHPDLQALRPPRNITGHFFFVPTSGIPQTVYVQFFSTHLTILHGAIGFEIGVLLAPLLTSSFDRLVGVRFWLI